MSNTENKLELLSLATDVVCAYISNNQCEVSDVLEMLGKVAVRLTEISENEVGGILLEDREPAVPIEESVTDDYIVCLEDGVKLKLLKRHLRCHYGMTPDEYRKRWHLPDSYPMVAPKYADRRSDLAKDIGLGLNRGKRKSNG